MTIRVPDTLTADNSEQYNVSIGLSPDGLSFSGINSSNKETFFSETVVFEREVSVIDSIKDLFFNNDCFSYLYKSLYVVCLSRRYTLMPEDVFSEKDKDLLFSFCFQHNEVSKVLVQPLEKLGSYLLFDTENEIYEFLVRSLITPKFIHSLSPMLFSWHEKSLLLYPKQLYVFIHDSFFDMACFERGELLFINVFDYETENDVLYFIMYVLKLLKVNQLKDAVFFYGNKNRCLSVMSVVKNYMEHVEFLSNEACVDFILPECAL